MDLMYHLTIFNKGCVIYLENNYSKFMSASYRLKISAINPYSMFLTDQTCSQYKSAFYYQKLV